MAKKKAAPRKPIDLLAKVREYKEIKSRLDELEKSLEAVKGDITDEMTALGKDELKVDIFTVRWKEVAVTRFDAKSFKQTHEKLYEQYSRQDTSRRLTVS